MNRSPGSARSSLPPLSPARRFDRAAREHGLAPPAGRVTILAVVFSLSLLASPAAPVDLPPVQIVPADDIGLASMVLLAAGAKQPVVLFDPQDADVLKRFIGEAGRPVECLVRPGTPSATRAAIEAVVGTPCARVDDLVGFARRLWPETRIAVIASTTNYETLLRGAALAAAAGAALLPVSGDAAGPAARLDGWPLDLVYVLPGPPLPTVPGAHVVRLKSAAAVDKIALRRLGDAPHTVVVANPRDREGLFSPSSLSLLAPLIAATHRAPLVLVSTSNADGVESEVQGFIAAHALAPTHIYLVGDEIALRSHRVPDPVLQAGGPEALGGDREVRVELFSELQNGRPQDYAVGRFVAESAARGSATLARQLHIGLGSGERVLILSNAEQEFALGETISRTTVSELRNLGIKVRAQYGDAVTPAAIRDALEQAGVLVWEGHARDLTLEERGGVAVERTPPLVVLQGCYTLERSDPFILLERGTQAIVATSTAVYSASGTAFARALFDGLLYDDADLGTAVRNARNYLLAVTELKKRRKHSDWTKTYRAALAFALWGDPNARPTLPVQAPKLPPANWQVDGDALDLAIPKRRLKSATVDRYSASPVPRAMLSGLILRDGDRPEREIKELFYGVVHAPSDVSAACAPAPGWEVISFLAPHTRTLSVLARPEGDTMGHPAPAGDFRLPLVASASRCDARSDQLRDSLTPTPSPRRLSVRGH